MAYSVHYAGEDKSTLKTLEVTYQEPGYTKIFSGDEALKFKGKPWVESLAVNVSGDYTLASGTTADELLYDLTLSGKEDKVIAVATWSDCINDTTTKRTTNYHLTDPDISVKLIGAYEDSTIFMATIPNYDKKGNVYASFTINSPTTISYYTAKYMGGKITKNLSYDLNDVVITIHYAETDVVTYKSAAAFGTSRCLSYNKPAAESDRGISYTVTGEDIKEGTTDVEGSYFYFDLINGGKKYLHGEGGNELKIFVESKEPLPASLDVTKRPTKNIYNVDEGDGVAFNPSGMVIYCTYNNGERKDVTNEIRTAQSYTPKVVDSTTEFITFSYTENEVTVSCNMSINVNRYLKSATVERSYAEQYEISRVLFRSKRTEDIAARDAAAKADDEEDEDSKWEEEEDYGKWQDIMPSGDYSAYDSSHKPEGADDAIIKAGYGFELKVFVSYWTNRGEQDEWDTYTRKERWDNVSDYSSIPDSSAPNDADHWKYLNDRYPQTTPVDSPDIMYFRTRVPEDSTGAAYDPNAEKTWKKNLITYDESGNVVKTDFLVMDKTNLTENEEEIAEGEWYNSTKIFELPLRTVVEDGMESDIDDAAKKAKYRRVYVSKDAAKYTQESTKYWFQIISPVWYGYEPEAYFSEETFHYSTDEDSTYAQKTFAPVSVSAEEQTKYLHVCMGVELNVKVNDDIKTHILE